MKCSGENVILRGTFHVVSRFPQHFMLYRGNVDCFSVYCMSHHPPFTPLIPPLHPVILSSGQCQINLQCMLLYTV